MAVNGYMSIVGERQGLISAGCNSQPSIGNKCQSLHQDEILVLAYSHELANPGSTQRAIHRPVMITKLVDKASPLLAQAVDSREVVRCDIHLYRFHPAGHQERYFSVKLEGAVIVADNIRKAVQAKELLKRSTNEKLGRITASFGVAVYHPGDTPSSLIDRADRCLYAAKHAGRNRVFSETELKTDGKTAAA